LEEEVRGVDALKAFSQYLVHPYQPGAANTREALEAEAQRLKEALSCVETKLKELKVTV
jgi:hypothetical protein